MNLQDRMQPGLVPSKSSETTMKEKRNCCDTGSSLKNPERKSDPDSEAYVIMEQQSKVIAQLTEQRDHLIAEGRPEDRKKIEMLTDRLSLVKKELTRRDSIHQSCITEVQTKLEATQTENAELNEKLLRAYSINCTLRTEIKALTNENEDLRKEGGLVTREEYQNLKERCAAAEADSKRLHALAVERGFEDFQREKEAFKEEKRRLLNDIEDREAAANQKVKEAESRVAQTKSEADHLILSANRFAFISWALFIITVFGWIIVKLAISI